MTNLAHIAMTRGDGDDVTGGRDLSDFDALRAEHLRDGIVWRTDPGHSWLMVSPDQIKRAGLTEADFSSCSHRSGDDIALEEDCDAAIYLLTLFSRDEIMKLPQHDGHTNGEEPLRRWGSYGKNPDVLATMRRLMAK